MCQQENDAKFDFVPEFNEILTRASRFSPEICKSDAGVASALGVNRTTPATWRKRNKIPYEAIIEYAKSKRLNIQWLLTGEGDPLLDNFSDFETLQSEDTVRSVLLNDTEAEKRRNERVRFVGKANNERIKFLHDVFSFLDEEDRQLAVAAFFEFIKDGNEDLNVVKKVVNSIRSNATDFEKVPVIDVEISAGFGANIEREKVRGYLAFRGDWLKEKHLSSSRLAVVFAKGDSMQPTVNDGDALLVDMRPIEKIADGIHVLRMDDHLFVKRLQKAFTGDIEIISDNNFYKPQTVAPDQLDKLNVIGKVVWIGKEV
ncbi:LexA family transcriptional regulator [Pseudoalteromonas sp. ASV78]|uniref:LexA family transcriptional regulator n=1 Tax=Pseudoalteromonas sp. ASV78 TaxID=3397851 RepID=UPI0039FD9520